MPTLRRRLVLAGVATAAAVAIPTAALAAGSGSPPTKPTAPASAAPAPASAAPAPAAAASQKAAARQAQGQTGQPSIAAALATRLGISASAAQHVIAQLGALGRGGVDPNSAAFAAIARDAGVSPARLASALTEAKQSLAGS
jgi:pyruvate dehydrogenase E2 component (dihydrolipoamide acetyltransferase)